MVHTWEQKSVELEQIYTKCRNLYKKHGVTDFVNDLALAYILHHLSTIRSQLQKRRTEF